MNVPQLRFKEFDGVWSKVALSSFFIERSIYPSDALPLFSLTIENGVTPKTERYERSFLVTDEKEAYKVVEPNDFAYNPMNLRFGAIAKYHGLEPVTVSKYYNIFYCNSLVSSDFCEFYLKTDKMVAFYDKMSTGSLSEKKRVHFSDFLNFKIPFPTISEQTKIANFLTAIDERINQLTRKKELMTQYKQGVMQQIFSQQIRFKDDNGEDFADWEEKKLKKIAYFFSGGTPLTTRKDFYNGDIPFIKSGEISSDSTEQFITQLGLDNSSAKMAVRGDILYALYGATSGEVAISKIDGAINQAVLCIRSNSLSHYYLYVFLRFKKEKILKNYIQGGQGNLSAEIIKNLLIPTPSLAEQTKIANFLTAIDEKIQQISQQIEATKQYKQGLLQQMFV